MPLCLLHVQKQVVGKMSKVFELYGYIIYFWSNENGEPVHVHISKGVQSSTATKIWITQTGDVLLAHNKSRIPKKDLNKLMKFIASFSNAICQSWYSTFGYIKFYC